MTTVSYRAKFLWRTDKFVPQGANAAMTPKTETIPPQLITAIALMMAILIFGFDLSVKLGIAGAVPYVIVILLTLYIPGTKATYFFAGLVSILTLVGLYFSPAGGELWQVAINRILALVAIWATVTVTLLRKKSELNVLAAYDNLETIIQDRTKEYIDAANKAEQADKAKSTFLSRMSHELRTPLNGILGFAQLLDSDNISTNKSKEYIKQILDSSHHLLSLITEILEYAVAESGQTRVNITHIECDKLINECVGIITPLAEKRKITIINNISLDHSIIARADYIRLKQVLLNLLSNAVKYNADRGSITLSYKIVINKNDRLLIGVIDTGPGISESEQEKLFQPFSRLSYADANAIDGIGIGLAYSKQLMEIMDGSIWVKSTSGQGSEFWIDLPYILPTDIFETKTQPTSPPAYIQAVTSRINVLYIEDNKMNLGLIRDILSGARPSFTFFSAPSAERGLEIARSIQPAIILLDIQLPGMSGIDMMEIMKADDTLGDIPVIAISADASPETIEKASQAGVKEYITKPFAVDHFLNVLDTTIKEKSTAG